MMVLITMNNRSILKKEKPLSESLIMKRLVKTVKKYLKMYLKEKR